MPRSYLLVDEFHLSVLAPRRLDDAAVRSVRRVLNDRHFQSELRRAVHTLVGRYRALSPVRVRLSR
jgi:hypothetical protein